MARRKADCKQLVCENVPDLKRNAMHLKPNSVWDMLETAVLAIAAAGLLYFGYFQLAPWIWSQNLPFNPAEVTPWTLPWLEERDGIELYALYTLMLLNLIFAYTLTRRWNRLAERPARYFLVLPLVIAGSFVGSVGFHPPMSTLSDHVVSDIFAQSLKVLAVILPILALLYFLLQRSARWMMAAVALILIPVCFISTAPLSWLDYGYILAPSLHLLHGAGVSEIYFQYDLLLSLIGLAWLKLRLDPNLFQVAGQLSYYLLLLGLFAFSRRWFLDKRLPIFFLAALILVRIYAGPFDAVLSFQVTPLRLDLWLILLILVYFKGPYHWSAAFFCGLMLLLHKNFGIIYSAAYIQMLLTLCAINIDIAPGKPIKTTTAALRDFFKKNYRNLALILAGALAQYLLFRNANVPADFYYSRLGIGFTKIAANSFYWYAVAVSGLSFVLLLRLRAKVPGNYLAAGFCLAYLAIGNSLYFFGRSHENNIINISVALLLLFFLLLDLAGHAWFNSASKPTKSFIQGNLTTIFSLAFIASITLWYGDSITNKAAIQAQNAGKGQFIYPSKIPEHDVLNTIAEVKSISGDDPKVYFVTRYDFLYYYYGGYAPVGYYNPLTAWISRNDFSRFLQELMGQGYYLVVDKSIAKEVLSSIGIPNYRYIQRSVVVWK